MTEAQTGSTEDRAISRQVPALIESNDYSQFTLRAKSEILFVMRKLLDSASPITMYFNEGRDLLLTSLVAIDDEGLLLDFGGDAEINRKAVTVEKLFCVASHEKVRIQFLLRGLAQVSFDGRPAFRAALPDDVLRLQRREFFRLDTPVARPLQCLIPLVDGAGDTQFIDVNVMDISGGGIGLAVPDGIAFEVGAEFPDCRIYLPEAGAVTATLKVCNQFEIALRGGGRAKRAGCEFVDLPGPMLTIVQRYIMKVERERKARESGAL